MTSHSDSTPNGDEKLAEPGESILDSQLSRNGEPTAEALLVGQDSAMDPQLSIIMPTLNEEGGIQECLTRAKNAIAELGVPAEIIISDSSTDRTPEIARENGAIVVEPVDRGYGNAYKYAFERASGEFVAIGDADTTYDFEELPGLIRQLIAEDADIAIGSRLAGTIKPGAMPALHRYVGNPLLTRFLNTFYDAGVTDAHSGLRVLRRDALLELDLNSDGMEFASEMIMDAAAKGMQITEQPITYHEREGDATLDSFRDGWRHVKFMLVNAPGYLFSAPGALLVLLGLGIIAASLVQQTVGGVTFASQTMVGGSLLTIIGYQIGAFGLFSSIATEPIREPGDPITNWVRRNFQLEHGAFAGLAVCCLGTTGLAVILFNWLRSGADTLPSAMWTLAGATAVIVGTQTVFSSFFLSMLVDSTGDN